MENYSGSFENWWAAAELYCSEHPELDFWDFQVQEFASDIAWRMEGIDFTENQMDWAFEDWTNGNSPYSKRPRDRATTPEEGYDMWQKWEREKAKTRVKKSDFALNNGVPIVRLHEFLNGVGGDNDLYFEKEYAEHYLKKWNKLNEN